MKKLLLGAFLLASFAAYGEGLYDVKTADVKADVTIIAPLEIAGTDFAFGTIFIGTAKDATAAFTVTSPGYQPSLDTTTIVYTFANTLSMTHDTTTIVADVAATSGQASGTALPFTGTDVLGLTASLGADDTALPGYYVGDYSVSVMYDAINF